MRGGLLLGERIFPWGVFPFYFGSSLLITGRETELLNKNKTMILSYHGSKMSKPEQSGVGGGKS